MFSLQVFHSPFKFYDHFKKSQKPDNHFILHQHFVVKNENEHKVNYQQPTWTTITHFLWNTLSAIILTFKHELECTVLLISWCFQIIWKQVTVAPSIKPKSHQQIFEHELKESIQGCQDNLSFSTKHFELAKNIKLP